MWEMSFGSLSMFLERLRAKRWDSCKDLMLSLDGTGACLTDCAVD